MDEDAAILKYFMDAALIQAVVHTGRHPDCKRETCEFPECDLAHGDCAMNADQ